MMDLITATPRVVSAAPAADDLAHHAQHVVAIHQNRLISGKRPGEYLLPELPSADHRAVMIERMAQLDAALTPVQDNQDLRDDARISLLALLGTYSAKVESSTVTAYQTHLLKYPLFAINQACAAARSGAPEAKEIGVKASFQPSMPHLYQLSERYVAPYRAERTRLSVVLNAKLDERSTFPTPRSAVSAKARESQLARAEAEQRDLANRESARARLLDEANERSILAEYRRAGVEPYRNAAGALVSMALLLKTGARVVSGAMVVPRISRPGSVPAPESEAVDFGSADPLGFGSEERTDEIA